MEIQSFYKIKGYRLADETINNLAKIKKETGISYNLLFAGFVNSFMNIKQSTRSGKVIWENIKEGEECPYCQQGQIIKRIGKYGSFWACSNFPNCGFTQSEKLTVKNKKD